MRHILRMIGLTKDRKSRLLTSSQKGATLVEMLVAIALMGIMLPALVTALVAANAGRPSDIQNTQAASLLREASEAVRSIREKGWSNISTNGTYHPVISGSAWALASGSETINGYTRQIVVSDAERNTGGTLVANGGTADPSTKHVVITVSWTTPVAASVTTDEYLTRWQNNSAWTQTNQSDFSAGTLTNSCATVTCAPNMPANSVTLADTPSTWQLPSVIGSYNITGNVAGNDVFVATINSVPYAFVGYSGGVSIINISNPASPTLASTVTTSAAVNGVFVAQTGSDWYLYMATSITTAQLVIAKVTNPAAPGANVNYRIQDNSNSAANSVYVTGGYAYVVKNQVTQGLFTAYGEFNVVNVANPAAPAAVTGGNAGALNIGSNCTSLVVSGNTAYVTTAKNNSQLVAVNVSTKASPASSATVSLGATANDITMNAAGTTVYIGTANNTSTGELRIYNVTPASPGTAPTSVGSYEVGGVVSGVGIDTTNPNYLALATQVASKQAIIVNISTPASPTLVNNITLGGNGNKVALNGAYAYYGTADTSKELTVIYGGYRPSGTFESQTFDAGVNASYNYLNFTGSAPTGTTLQFQVAANNTGSGWSYEGPDGTSGTFYSAAGAIPLNITSNRYFRYKATLTTTNGQVTPVINDTEVNYSL